MNLSTNLTRTERPGDTMTRTTMTRESAIQELAETLADIYDKRDIEAILIDGFIGLEERSNGEIEALMSELADQEIVIAPKEVTR